MSNSSLLTVTFDTRQPRKPERTKSCCTICLKITWSCGLRPLKAASWLATVSWVWIPFMTFVKCHRCSVSPTISITFNFILSIMGSHKNNLYYQCQSERRITTSLPPLSEGLIMGWKERWAWGILAAQSANGCMGLNCSSHTVASLSLHVHATLQRTHKMEMILLERWIVLSFFIKRLKNGLNLEWEQSNLTQLCTVTSLDAFNDPTQTRHRDPTVKHPVMKQTIVCVLAPIC